MSEADSSQNQVPNADPVPAKRKPTQRHKASPLNEQDWIDSAMDILVRENVRGVRIDALCKTLGVTKGSFYWHFKTRNELLLAMLQHWRRRMTLNVIQSIIKSGSNSRERLRNLIGLVRRPKSPAFAQIESSIRDWARRVEMPREVVSEVDGIRLDYFKKLFADAGFPEEEAHRRAYLTYCIMMGDSVLHRTLDGGPHEKFLDDALDILLKDRKA